MSWWRVALVVVAFIMTVTAGCTTPSETEAGGEAGDSTTVPQGEAEAAAGETATTEVPQADSPATTEIPLSISDLPGLLAVTDLTERLLILEPDGFESELIDGGGGVLARQPTWSPDGETLAWASLGPAGQSIATRGVASGERLDSALVGSPAFYLQWNATSDRLGYLRASERPGQIEFGIATPGNPASAAGEGAPYFFSWANASDQLAAHVDDDRLVSGTIANGGTFDSAVLTTTGGGFSTPDWISDSELVTVVDGQLSIVNSNSGAVGSVLADNVGDAGVRFTLNRPSGRLAYQRLDGSSGLTLREPDGTETFIAEVTPLAWEWSPDGDRLAVLDPAGDGRQVRWLFLDVATQQTIATTGSFTPSQRELRDYLPFFAQYAQSHRHWSPDGQGFAYAGATPAGAGIWVQLVNDGAQAQLIGSGDYVTWSPVAGSAFARSRV